MSSRSRTILVLDAECNAATCVVQSLGKAGHRLHLAGTSVEAFSFWSRYVSKTMVYPSPLKTQKGFLTWFDSVAGDGQYDYILPLSDLTLYPLRSLSRNIPGIVLPPEDSFEWFFDKSKTLELAKRCGVPVPRSFFVRSFEKIECDGIGPPPYFVKLTRSKLWTGDKGFDHEARLVRSFHDMEEVISFLTRFGPVLVQEYVPGVGVGIEMLCSKGRLLMAFAHQRIHEYPLTGGGSSYRVSIDLPPVLLEASERLVKEANWTGVAMVEFKKDGDNFFLMEVNGRFWGSLPLSYRSGIDFPKALIDLLEGNPIVENPKYRTGIYSRRFSTDLAWFKRNLLSDKGDPYTKTRPVGQSLLEYGRFFSGREHWDHGYFSDPFPVLAEMGTTIKKMAISLAINLENSLLRKVVLRSKLRDGFKGITGRPDFRDRPLRILVVCYGNICRSPFVERLLRKELDPEFFEVFSCGFLEKEGRISPEDYLHQVRCAGVELADHQSRALTQDRLDWADLVLLMDLHNWKSLRKFDPVALNKVVWLGAWRSDGQWEIPDPYGKSPKEMEQIVNVMREATHSLAKEIRSFRGFNLPQMPI